MIKIAFVIDTIESPTAGTEKQLLMLIRHLDRSRFQPVLCVLRSSEWLEKEFDLCPLFVAGVYSFKSMQGIKGVLALSQLLKKERMDIVQTHFRDSSIAGILAARLAGMKTIIGTRRNQGYWHNRLEILILRVLNRWVTCFLANSENTRQWAAQTEGIELDRVAVIYNCLETGRYYKATPEQRSAFRTALGFPKDAVVVGIVANLRPVKALDVFVRAAKLVTERCPKARFVLVGDGSERVALERLSSDLGIISSLRYLGKRLDIPDILSVMDIGVLTSESESFSNAVIEYMAAGLPVISTDVGGVREAVTDGVNGYVVPVGDWQKLGTCIALLLHSDQMEKMGQESRKLSLERFGLMEMMAQTERLYMTLVGDRAGKPQVRNDL